jgi:hypothetical protein
MQAEQWGGVLTICGAIDKEQKPLLMASYNDDGCVRLFDLPSFQVRSISSHDPWLSGDHMLGGTRHAALPAGRAPVVCGAACHVRCHDHHGWPRVVMIQDV